VKRAGEPLIDGTGESKSARHAGSDVGGSGAEETVATSCAAAAIEHEPSGRTGQVGISLQHPASAWQQIDEANVATGLTERSTSTHRARITMARSYQRLHRAAFGRAAFQQGTREGPDA